MNQLDIEFSVYMEWLQENIGLFSCQQLREIEGVVYMACTEAFVDIPSKPFVCDGYENLRGGDCDD